MRFVLHYILFDGFDPETAELALRVGTLLEGTQESHILRLKLHLGRNQDAIQPLRRELQTQIQMPLPPLWDKGLKIIIRAIEDEMNGDGGRMPQRYTWVRTQMLHPTDERRSTLNHPVARQSEILWEWAQRFDQDGDALRAMEIYERMLLLSPLHESALSRMAALLRQQCMIEEMLTVVERWLSVRPKDVEAILKKGEGLLHLERFRDAQQLFLDLLVTHPVHPLAHLGAAQAKSYAGGDPLPHLDAALELEPDIACSVLKETFDYRVLVTILGETVYAGDELPTLMGVTPGEVKSFLTQHGLPHSGTGQTAHPAAPELSQIRVRESELSRWVSIQNRYQLLPMGLHWIAPTPRRVPELP